MKEKVIKRLVKWGNNEIEATKMVNCKSSDWAFRSFSTPARIAEAIINTYGINGVAR
jgi:hypothetical protein